jgi:hypothetical protein
LYYTWVIDRLFCRIPISKMSDAASDDSLAGVTYWGCTSKLHRLCLEAEQKPLACSWDRVIDFMITNPQEANETAVLQEGQLKLTPLVCGFGISIV